MQKIAPVSLSINNVVARFYLMIAVTLIFGFLGQWTLAAIFGYVIGLSAILGLSKQFGPPKSQAKIISKKEAKMLQIENPIELKKAS